MSSGGSDDYLSKHFAEIFAALQLAETDRREAQARAEDIFSSGKPFPLESLPPELLDEILAPDELFPSELAICCRLSQSLLPHARKALYSTLTFTFLHLVDDSRHYCLEQRSDEMADVVWADKGLAKLVKSVLVTCEPRKHAELARESGLPCAEFTDENREQYELSPGWLRENATNVVDSVDQFLLTFINLTTLNFPAPPGFSIDFLSHVTLFPLTRIKIPYITVAIVHCLPHLTSLDCTLYDEDADVEARHAHPPRLQRLDLKLERTTSGRSGLVTFFDFLTRNSHDSLTCLSLPNHPRFQPTLAPSSNLSHLKITVFSGICPPPFGLPFLIHLLQSVTSSLTYLSIYGGFPNVLSLPHSYLARLPSSLIVLTHAADIFPPSLVIELVDNAEKNLPCLKHVVLSRRTPEHNSGEATRGSIWRSEDFERIVELCALQGLEGIVETAE